MKNFKNKNIHVIKLQKNEDVNIELRKYIKKNNIGFAKIEAIGMLKNIHLGILNEKEEYNWKTFEQGELISYIGNISWEGDEVVIHAHASFATEDYSMFGGHFGDAKVGAIMEIFITELPIKVKRIKSDKVKFKTWNI